MTLNRYAPLENIDKSFKSSPGDNLLQLEINAATQDQISNNGRRQERKKALIIGDSMVKGIKRWKINKKMKFTNPCVNCFPGANTSDMKHYAKPPAKKNPNSELVIIHTGTNDLSRTLHQPRSQQILWILLKEKLKAKLKSIVLRYNFFNHSKR